MEIKERALACAGGIIEELGYETVDVEYAREDGLMCLTFYIYKEEGVSLSDCEAVSQAIEDAVEQADVTQGQQYCLCVSSPGERELKTPRDFERNIGREVTVEIKKAVSGKKKKFRGVLTAYDGDKVTISDGKCETVFNTDNIKTVKPYIGF